MKWIVVILVLLNLSAWLIGKKFDPDAQQDAGVAQLETINATAMTVILPEQELAQRKVNEATMLEEESLAQLKLDKRGKVLMAPSTPKLDEKPVVSEPRTESKESVEIVALDRSKPEAPAAPVELTKKPVPEPTPIPEAPAKPVLKCYRLGPFNSQNSLASARRALEKGGIGYAVDDSGAAKKIKAVRIYLGAYANTAALEAEKSRLKRKKIEHYVVTLNGTPVVQLGYFSEPARAKAFQKTLGAKGIEAKADTIYHEANIKSWLDVQPASKDSIVALKLADSAKIKEQACR